MPAAFLALLLLFPAALHAEVNLPDGRDSDPILITAQMAYRWQMDSYEVWILHGDVRFAQGDDLANAQDAVFWIDHAETAGAPGAPTRKGSGSQRTKVIAYLEGNVRLRLPRDGRPVEIRDQKWFGRFYTNREVRVQAGAVAGKPSPLPEVYQRGLDQRNPEFGDALRQTHAEPVQYVAPATGQAAAGSSAVGEVVAAPAPSGAVVTPPGTRRIRYFSRGEVPPQIEWKRDEQSNQWILVIEQGVQIVIDGFEVPNASIPGVPRGPTRLDIRTDRLVLWTTSRNQPDISGRVPQNENEPMELYLEGNVVFLQGNRQIFADRMYYDVRNHVGTVLAADMITPAPGYEGKLHIHADVLQEEGPNHFRGQEGYITPSRLGVPRIRLQPSEFTYDEIPSPETDPYTGGPLIDPRTGQPEVQKLVSGQNNFVYVENVPVFWWPTFATDLNDPSYFVRGIRYKDDNVFGDQLYFDFSAYQLFGIRTPPKGTDWTFSVDYLSLRGWAEGTTYTYNRADFFGIPGQVSGQWNFWGIDDHGRDNLGIGRSSVAPEPDVNYRYDIIGRHRQDLGDGWTFTAELGKVSDRNFLLEYFKSDWDTQPDPTTNLDVKLRRENSVLELFAQERLDNFVTETNWLPRADHFLLGESLLGDHLTWFEHTSVGYAQFQVGTLPSAAAGDEPTSHLPWEPQDFNGGRFVTRNELDLPFELGPVKVVPYVLGEIGYWGQDLNGQDLTRAYYQAGIRATLPMWAVDSEAESSLWNVHGLAHKVDFEVEYLHAQSNASVTELPLYDPLDDQNIEDFRRRFVVNTFGLPVVAPPGTQGPPAQFDERLYALRTDMEGWVTAPSMEIAGDLDELRLGVHQRWQTKRGPADSPHIIDWIEFDTDVTIFPDPDRDNFGELAGLLDYNFIWHIGDRLTVLSDGIFDFFDEGQKIVTVGAFLTRPPRGSLYLGYRLLQGPIDSQVVTASYAYWMSPKWISATGVTIDLHQVQNVSPNFQLMRVGESLLWTMSISYDPARQTAGFNLSVEPRFLPKLAHSPAGIHIPPAGESAVE